MALPVTISTTHRQSDQGGHSRPFRSSDGDVYVILHSLSAENLSVDIVQDGDLLHVVAQHDENNANAATLRAFRATDPTSSFSAVDTGGEPSFTSAGADVWYARFDMSLNSGVGEWVEVATGDVDILIVDPGNTTGNEACSIALRSDGDIVVVYNGAKNKVMGVDFSAVKAAVSTDNGQTWTTDLVASPIGVEVNYHVGPIVIPPNNSDQAHIFWKRDDGTSTLGQRAMDNANSFQTDRDTGFGVDATGVQDFAVRSAMAFTRGGSDFVKVIYEGDGSTIEVYEMAPFSDDTDPTSSDSEDTVVSEDPGALVETPFIDFVFDPGTETIHSLHADATGDDIQHHDDQGTDTWQDNGTVVTGTITGSGPDCNIYDRDGAKIGYVYTDSSANVIYNEIDVTPSTTALSEVDMGQQNSYHGPFEVGSDHYMIGLAGNDHDIVAVKATPATPVDADWNSVDTPVRVAMAGPNGTGNDSLPGWLTQDPVVSIWAFEDSSDLHVAVQQRSGRVSYHVFDPGTDAWTTRDQNDLLLRIGATNFDDVPAFPAVSLALRSDGDVVIVAAYADATNETLRAFTKQGSTWANEGEATAGTASTDYQGVSVVGPDGSDRISWAYGDITNDDVDLQSLSSADAFGTVTEIDAAVDTANLLVAPGVIDSSNIIYVSFIDSDDQISVGSWTSGAAPTPSVDATVGDNTVYGHGRTTAPFVAACLAIDGTDVHLVYAQDSDQDVYHDDDVDGGGATDTEIIDAVTANRISCNIYTSALHVLYDDGGTTKYHEQSLAAAAKTIITNLDAALQEQFEKTASIDAAVQQDFTRTASLDAALAAAQTRTAQLNAAIEQLKTATTDLDAALLSTTALTTSLDAGVAAAQTRTASLDAALAVLNTATASLDAAVQQDKTRSASLDAALQQAKTLATSLQAAIAAQVTTTTDIDAAIQKVETAQASLDAALAARNTATTNIDAAVQQAKTATASLDAALADGRTRTTDLDAAVQQVKTAQANMDAALQDTATQTTSLDAALAEVQTAEANLDAVVAQGKTRTTSLDAALQELKSANVSLDAAIQAVNTRTANLDAAVEKVNTVTTGLDASIQGANPTITTSLDAALLQAKTLTVSLDAALQEDRTRTASMDAAIAVAASITASLNAVILLVQASTTSLDAAIQIAAARTLSLDAALQEDRTRLVSLDAVLATGNTRTVSLDAALQEANTAVTNLDAAVQKAQLLTASLDAALQEAKTATASLDAVLALGNTRTASLDGVLQAQLTVDTSLSAAVQAAQTLTASLDAALQVGATRTTSLDAGLANLIVLSANLSAVFEQRKLLTSSVDAAVRKDANLVTTALDAFISTAAALLTTSLDAVVARLASVTASLNAAILAQRTKALSLDAAVGLPFSPRAPHSVPARATCVVGPDGRNIVIPPRDSVH